MAGKKIELGASGATVAANVKRLRDGRLYTEISKRLQECGRDIPPLALRRIEDGSRRVDADDLVALALALDVSPVALLMPQAATHYEFLSVNGMDRNMAPASRVWEWLTAKRPLLGESTAESFRFLYRSCPEWTFGALRAIEQFNAPNASTTVERKDDEPTDGDDH